MGRMAGRVLVPTSRLEGGGMIDEVHEHGVEIKGQRTDEGQERRELRERTKEREWQRREKEEKGEKGEKRDERDKRHERQEKEHYPHSPPLAMGLGLSAGTWTSS